MNPRTLLRTLWPLFAALACAVASRAATVRVEVGHVFGDRALQLGDLNCTNSAGDVLSVTRLDYLLSDFALVTAGGGAVALTNQSASTRPSRKGSPERSRTVAATTRPP